MADRKGFRNRQPSDFRHKCIMPVISQGAPPNACRNKFHRVCELNRSQKVADLETIPEIGCQPPMCPYKCSTPVAHSVPSTFLADRHPRTVHHPLTLPRLIETPSTDSSRRANISNKPHVHPGKHASPAGRVRGLHYLDIPFPLGG